MNNDEKMELLRFVINRYYGEQVDDERLFEIEAANTISNFIRRDLKLEDDLNVIASVGRCTLTVTVNYNDKCYEWVLKPSE